MRIIFFFFARFLCCAGGSGFADTLHTIESLKPAAAAAEGCFLGSSAAADPGSDVTEGLSGIGLE